MEKIGEDAKIKIMLNISYERLVILCQTTSEYAHICNNDSFWQLKAEIDFGVIISNFNSRDEYIYLMLNQSDLSYEKKLIGILILGHEFESTSLCGRGQTVNLGETESNVRKVCGVSTFRNNAELDRVIGQKEVTRWTYTMPFSRDSVLEFEKGMLVRIQ